MNSITIFYYICLIAILVEKYFIYEICMLSSSLFQPQNGKTLARVMQFLLQKIAWSNCHGQIHFLMVTCKGRTWIETKLILNSRICISCWSKESELKKNWIIIKTLNPFECLNILTLKVPSYMNSTWSWAQVGIMAKFVKELHLTNAVR